MVGAPTVDNVPNCWLHVTGSNASGFLIGDNNDGKDGCIEQDNFVCSLNDKGAGID
jgi:hypothetical protein